MTAYQFIYIVITTLLMNDNAFIYPMFDGSTGEIKALYPLKPSIVEPIIDSGGSYYLKFSFDREESFTTPYENSILN